MTISLSTLLSHYEIRGFGDFLPFVSVFRKHIPKAPAQKGCAHQGTDAELRQLSGFHPSMCGWLLSHTEHSLLGLKPCMWPAWVSPEHSGCDPKQNQHPKSLPIFPRN